MDNDCRLAAVSYTGTILGGPHDGDIVTCEWKRYVMVERVKSVYAFYAEAIPTAEPITWREVYYDWKMDDDGRGWFVRVRPHACP